MLLNREQGGKTSIAHNSSAKNRMEKRTSNRTKATNEPHDTLNGRLFSSLTDTPPTQTGTLCHQGIFCLYQVNTKKLLTEEKNAIWRRDTAAHQKHEKADILINSNPLTIVLNPPCRPPPTLGMRESRAPTGSGNWRSLEPSLTNALVMKDGITTRTSIYFQQMMTQKPFTNQNEKLDGLMLQSWCVNAIEVRKAKRKENCTEWWGSSLLFWPSRSALIIGLKKAWPPPMDIFTAITRAQKYKKTWRSQPLTVRVLTTSQQGKKVVHMMETHKLDILFLQETHINTNTEEHHDQYCFVFSSSITDQQREEASKAREMAKTVAGKGKNKGKNQFQLSSTLQSGRRKARSSSCLPQTSFKFKDRCCSTWQS